MHCCALQARNSQKGQILSGVALKFLSHFFSTFSLWRIPTFHLMDKGFESTYWITANNVRDNYSFCECLNCRKFHIVSAICFFTSEIELLLWQLFNEGNYSMEEIIFKNMLCIIQRFISHCTGQKIKEGQVEIIVMKNITSFNILSSTVNSPSHIRWHLHEEKLVYRIVASSNAHY